MRQNWNNILSFIKLELGSKINIIEFSDHEIINNLKEHVLPLFAQYVPIKENRVKINNNNKKEYKEIGEHVYILPINKDEYITDIIDIVSKDNLYFDPYFDTKYEGGRFENIYTGLPGDLMGSGMINTVISNTYNDISDFLSVRNTHKFIPPNLLSFNFHIDTAIVIYNTLGELKYIRPDMYNMIFKKMCLGYTQRWLVSLRNKFENLQTPTTTININWQELKQESERNINESHQALNDLPPDELIYFI